METQPQSPQQAGAAQGQVRDPASLSSASLRRPQRGATILIAGALLLTAAIFARPSMAGADAAFEVTDDPGRWFRNVAGPIGGSQSLAVIQPGGRITLSWKSKSVHTVTSLIFPTGATGMPFDSGLIKGGGDLILRTPGLYVFVCKVHPYMLGAVIVDDPNTTGLDLGDSITLVNGITVPTSSDLATRLLRTFFIATNPANWQDQRSSLPWHVTYPNVDVRVDIGVVNLPAVLNARYGNDTTFRRSPIRPSREWRGMGRYPVRAYGRQNEARDGNEGRREHLAGRQKGLVAQDQYEQSSQHVDRQEPDADLSDPMVR